MPKILLASSSVYRKALFSRLQIPFTTYAPEIDETPLAGEHFPALVQRLAIEKAKAAYKHHPDSICIGSDEVAALKNTLLNKPGSHSRAREQLKGMSGQKVYFHTSVCVFAPFLDFQDCDVVTTSVTFRHLSDSMIENYLLKEKPYESAGSFKSEALGSALIERFEGEDPTAMIGLPLIRLCDMLMKVGVQIV